jgi:hypothetical protein
MQRRMTQSTNIVTFLTHCSDDGTPVSLAATLGAVVVINVRHDIQFLR